MPYYSFLTDPTPEEIRRITDLYRQAQWWSDTADNPAVVARIVSGSHCFVVAKASGVIVGMGRAISDGVSDAYIQDVTVDAAHRTGGIGTKIVRMLIQRIREDGLTWIGLIAERNSHQFYRRLGFNTMPDAMPLLMTSAARKPD